MSFDVLINQTTSVHITRFANANIKVGYVTLRGIFAEPSRLVQSFDLAVGSSAPTVIMLSADVVEQDMDSGTVVSIVPDNPQGIPGGDYQVAGPPQHDGEGLAVLTLTRG